MHALQEHQMREFFGVSDSPEFLHLLEHDPRIKTSITDKDMLLLNIDMALDGGDAEMFTLLTDELKVLEQST